MFETGNRSSVRIVSRSMLQLLAYCPKAQNCQCRLAKPIAGVSLEHYVQRHWGVLSSVPKLSVAGANLRNRQAAFRDLEQISEKYCC